MCAKLRVVGLNDVPEEPIDQYIREIDSRSVSTLPYDRLMIYYRKHKEYKKELDVIKKGIERLRKFYSDQQKNTFRRKLDPKLTAISKKISKSTGLLDKKGNEIYLPDPLPRWMKRQTVVEDKIEREKKNTKKVARKINPKK